MLAIPRLTAEADISKFHFTRLFREKQDNPLKRATVRRCRAEMYSASRAVASSHATFLVTGMVFQNYALFPHLTVAENIAFGMKQRGASKAARAKRVAELLDLIQLTGKGERHPSELSGGQRQRVAIARAVAHPPAILLMDELLGALDSDIVDNLLLYQQELSIAAAMG